MNMQGDPSDEARRSLMDAVAARRGHFRFESGHHGDLWLDLDVLLAEPRRTRVWAAALARDVAAVTPDLVCGPLIGGAFIAQLVAAELSTRFIYAERGESVTGAPRYRVPATWHRHLAGQRVLLVDDAVNAGSALVATLAALRAGGAELAGFACLLAQGDVTQHLAREHGAPFTSLTTLDRRLWAPEACPLCAAGRPLTDPFAGPG